jgi:hypothetical protein
MIIARMMTRKRIVKNKTGLRGPDGRDFPLRRGLLLMRSGFRKSAHAASGF